MRKWNPYNVTVEDKWVSEYAEKRKMPKWYARLLLNIGLFLTNLEYVITGKVKERGE
jgi:hypothetical protein